MYSIQKIVAHRGASHDAPENTVASIKLCWIQRADATEIDIHLTRDGRVVAIHDHTLQRTAGHSGEVAALDLATIRALDAGGWKNAAYAGEKVPTLAEILDVVPADKSIVIEIKAKGAQVVDAMKQVLDAGPVDRPRVILIAFDYDTLKFAKAALPGCTTLLLASGMRDGRRRGVAELDALITQACEAGFDGLNLGREWPIDADFVKRVHDAGLKFYVWTVNDVETARRLTEAGVDGITTDRPGFIRENLPRALG